MADIQNRIDAIQHFPQEAEKPIISQPELLFPALTLQLSGDIDERSMKSLADEIRRELLTYPDISAATVVGAGTTKSPSRFLNNCCGNTT